MIKLVIKPLVYKSQAESLYRDCCILSETEECLSVVVFLTVEWLEQAQQFTVFVCCSTVSLTVEQAQQCRVFVCCRSSDSGVAGAGSAARCDGV